MFNMFRKSFALGALMVLFISGQATSQTGPVITTSAPVGTIIATSPIWIIMPGVTENDGCASTVFYILQKSDPNFNIMYSALLAASASGKNVELYLTGCVSLYSTTYPNVTAVRYNP